jgi:hypothetical protein
MEKLEYRTALVKLCSSGHKYILFGKDRNIQYSIDTNGVISDIDRSNLDDLARRMSWSNINMSWSRMLYI